MGIVSARSCRYLQIQLTYHSWPLPAGIDTDVGWRSATLQSQQATSRVSSPHCDFELREFAQKDVAMRLQVEILAVLAATLLASTMAIAAEEPSEQVKRMDAAAMVLDEIMGTPDKGIPE